MMHKKTPEEERKKKNTGTTSQGTRHQNLRVSEGFSGQTNQQRQEVVRNKLERISLVQVQVQAINGEVDEAPPRGQHAVPVVALQRAIPRLACNEQVTRRGFDHLVNRLTCMCGRVMAESA